VSWRYAVLSLFALFIVVLLVFKNYEIWTLPIEVIPQKGVAKKSGTTIPSPSAVGVQKETKSIDSYIFISEKNIFHPERKEFSILGGPGKKPIARPQIILYGVTVTGEYQSATIVDPTRALRKGEREMLTLMKGEQVGEYKLVKVLPDRITLEAAGDTFEVLLYDPKVAKKRSDIKTETKPAVITSTLPTPGSPPGEAAKTVPQTQPVQQRELSLPRVTSPPMVTPSAPSTSSLPFIRRGRVPPDGSPSAVAPSGGISTGATAPVTGQTEGTEGN